MEQVWQGTEFPRSEQAHVLEFWMGDILFRLLIVIGYADITSPRLPL